jgi:hypothetical protein
MNHFPSGSSRTTNAAIKADDEKLVDRHRPAPTGYHRDVDFGESISAAMRSVGADDEDSNESDSDDRGSQKSQNLVDVNLPIPQGSRNGEQGAKIILSSSLCI